MIITSFSQKGFHEYGRRFIEGFIEHWKDEELTVYYEKGVPSSKPQDDRVTYIDLYENEDFAGYEMLLNNSDPLFRGIQLAPDGQQAYNFHYDAMRFYRKAYCMVHACRTGNIGRVAWVDADVIFQEDVPEKYLESLIPDDAFVAHLNREWMYTESGFIVFNTDHPANKIFMTLLYNSYMNGAFRYLGQFHDCYVIDQLIRLLAVPAVNLTKNEQSDHVFAESDMGKYMTHLKGPKRKEKGAALETDPVRKAS